MEQARDREKIREETKRKRECAQEIETERKRECVRDGNREKVTE